MTFDFTPVLRSFPFLLRGVVLTIELSLLSMVLAVGIGIVCASMRVYGGTILGWIGALYVDVMRSVPLIAIIVWVYFALPLLINRSMDPLAAGVLSLGAHTGAYMAEIFRAGIGSIAKGQEKAGLALGMTRAQVIRRVILPQALARMLPPISSQLIVLIKDSSLCSGIGVAELMLQAQALNTILIRPFEVFTVVAGVYFCLTYPIALGINMLFKRLAVESPG